MSLADYHLVKIFCQCAVYRSCCLIKKAVWFFSDPALECLSSALRPTIKSISGEVCSQCCDRSWIDCCLQLKFLVVPFPSEELVRCGYWLYVLQYVLFLLRWKSLAGLFYMCFKGVVLLLYVIYGKKHPMVLLPQSLSFSSVCSFLPLHHVLVFLPISVLHMSF